MQETTPRGGTDAAGYAMQSSTFNRTNRCIASVLSGFTRSCSPNVCGALAPSFILQNYEGMADGNKSL